LLHLSGSSGRRGRYALPRRDIEARMKKTKILLEDLGPRAGHDRALQNMALDGGT
jgi:hypothetical protein